MRRAVWTVWAGAVLALSGGCASGPLLDNPALVAAAPGAPAEPNPAFVPLGPYSYSVVFENVLRVLADFEFEVLESNRYDGRIETLPRVAPGILLACKPGSPEISERILATFQSYRHRVTVVIQPAEGGGFFVHVMAFRELEDVPRPIRATAGAAIFRTDNNVERQYEVIDPTVFESHWIPRGRDYSLEQAILQCLKKCM